MSHPPAAKNRLAGESSPYLLLHQGNPVDWYPWGEEALARARREDLPIFLSVGYSTCYWCHVMERESFSDPEIAALMNRSFVNVKVDREERPDLDEVYMTATQILAGQGGWPNSVFLTPSLKPFYAGTYFPPQERFGRPGFPTLVMSLADAWRKRRSDVEEQAEEVAQAMRRYLEERIQPGVAPPGEEAAARAVESLAHRFDPEWGGFGEAPKFPSPSNLFLLLELAGEDPHASEMLAVTLDQMARGGLQDQVGGGFHRYSTDHRWRVPHFEKMLYDNALLLEVYARWYAASGDPEAARVARRTAGFLGRELLSPEGALWSAVDAETGGREGAFYVWTREELEAALGPEDATFLAPILAFAGAPTFEGEHYVLFLPEPLAALAERRRTTRQALLDEVEPLLARLLAARERRPRPLTDDKVLADWNGMAIAGLATAGRLLPEPALVERAARAAGFVLDRMWPSGGPLLHAWRGGQGKVAAYLTDYVWMERGLLALHAATGEGRWLDAACRLAAEQDARLGDPVGGWFVAAESPDLLFRSKEVFDGATPAANAVGVIERIELARATGDAGWLRGAATALTAFSRLVESFPDAVRMLALAARRYAAAAGEDAAPAGTPGAVAGSTGALDGLDRAARDKVEVEARFEAASADGWRRFRLELAVAPGWHVNAQPASEPFLVATAVAGEGVELRRVVYPPGEELSAAGGAVAVYAGRVAIEGELRPNGEGEAPRLLLTFQPCDADRCLPPVRRPIPVGA